MTSIYSRSELIHREFHKSQEAAAECYDLNALRHKGDGVRLNFPDGRPAYLAILAGDPARALQPSPRSGGGACRMPAGGSERPVRKAVGGGGRPTAGDVSAGGGSGGGNPVGSLPGLAPQFELNQRRCRPGQTGFRGVYKIKVRAKSSPIFWCRESEWYGRRDIPPRTISHLFWMPVPRGNLYFCPFNYISVELIISCGLPLFPNFSRALLLQNLSTLLLCVCIGPTWDVQNRCVC